MKNFWKMLRSKLIVSFLAVVAVPMVCVLFFTYQQYHKHMIASVNNSVLQSLNQSVKTLGTLVDSMIASSNYIILNNEIKDVLYSANVEKNPYGNSYRLEDYKTIENVIASVQTSFLIPFNTYITMIDSQSRVYRNWLGALQEYHALFVEQDWYTKAMDARGYMIWTAPHQMAYKSGQDEGAYISLSRSLKYGSSSKTNAVLLLSIEEKEFYQKIFSGIQEGDTDRFWIVNTDNRIMSADDKSLIHLPVGELLGEGKNLEDDSGSFFTEFDGKKMLVNFRQERRTGWKIFQLTDYREMFREVNHTKEISIFIVVFLSAIFSCILIYIIIRITEPLKEIGQLMTEVEKGNFQVKWPVLRDDEIGRLGNSFNHMTQQLEQLLQEIEMEQKRKEKLRFEMLQAQINPHFLFNTLNSIKMMARMNQDTSVENMLSALGTLLHQTMDKDREATTIEKEIEVLKSYSLIQKMRYNKKFNICYQVEEGMEKYEILKFSLQPLIENCIYHGFDHEHEFLDIMVDIRSQGEDIRIVVQDNGKGMEAEKIRQIMDLSSRETEEHFNRIGLNNVIQRMKLHYGTAYGLHIESCLGEGTRIIILLPKTEGEPDESIDCG